MEIEKDKIYRVWGYARKSPDDKENTESSINNQKNLYEKFLNENSVESAGIWIDKNVSGSDRYRKGFSEVLNEIIVYKEKNEDVVCILWVKHQDRFARDSSFFGDTLKDLEARNIKVYSSMKGGFLSSDDLGDSVTALMDAHYIRTQEKKARILQEQKRELGLPSFNAPFG